MTKYKLPSTLKVISENNFRCVLSKATSFEGVTVTLYWADTNLPPKCVEVFCRYFNLKYADGKFPVREDRNPSPYMTAEQRHKWTAVEQENSLSYSLGEIRSFGKQYEIANLQTRPLRESDFKYPVGFKEKKNLVEVFNPDSSSVIDMFDMGLRNPKNEK